MGVTKLKYLGVFNSVSKTFVSLFSNVTVSVIEDGVAKQKKVPVQYADQRFSIAVNDFDSDDVRHLRRILPIISFKNQGYVLDIKKLSNEYNQDFGSNDGPRQPLPYINSFKVDIVTKNEKNMFEVLEQLLPFFNPSFYIPFSYGSNLQNRKDQYKITLNNISEMNIINDHETTDYYITTSLTFDIEFSLWSLPLIQKPSSLVERLSVYSSVSNTTIPSKPVIVAGITYPFTVEAGGVYKINDTYYIPREDKTYKDFDGLETGVAVDKNKQKTRKITYKNVEYDVLSVIEYKTDVTHIFTSTIYYYKTEYKYYTGDNAEISSEDDFKAHWNDKTKFIGY